MPLFVHVTDEKNAPAMRRSGIAMSKYGRGVYAMPVMPSFIVSHQWLRELRRGGARTLVGVYFRIDDDEPVRFGHYGKGAGHAGPRPPPQRACGALPIRLGWRSSSRAGSRRTKFIAFGICRNLSAGATTRNRTISIAAASCASVGERSTASANERPSRPGRPQAKVRRQDALEKESERRRKIERFRKSAIAKASLLAVPFQR